MAILVPKDSPDFVIKKNDEGKTDCENMNYAIDK